MKLRPNFISSTAIQVLLGVFGSCLCDQRADAQPEGILGYEVINFGEVPNGGKFVGRVLDEFARVHGEARRNGEGFSVPVTWINGEFLFLPLPPEAPHIKIGPAISPTTGIVVQAVWDYELPDRVVAWNINTLQYRVLGVLPGLIQCGPNGVNDSGWIVGGCSTLSFGRPALWIRGRDPIDIGDLGGGQAGTQDINERGWILGSSYRPGGRETWPVLWKPNGEIVDLFATSSSTDMAFVGHLTHVRGMNNNLEIVGEAPRAAFYWYDQSYTVLPEPNPCGLNYFAKAINDSGLIAGGGFKPGCTTGGAVVWERANDFEVHMIDDYLRAEPGTTILVPYDINNAGQIAALGELPGGEERGFLVTPYQFELSEPAPGVAGERNTITVTNLEPNQRVTLVFGTKPGAQPIGNGCLGGLVLIRDASTHQSLEAFADQSGNATFNVLVPKSTAGKTVRYQAIAPDECEISHTVEFSF